MIRKSEGVVQEHAMVALDPGADKAMDESVADKATDELVGKDKEKGGDGWKRSPGNAGGHCRPLLAKRFLLEGLPGQIWAGRLLQLPKTYNGYQAQAD